MRKPIDVSNPLVSVIIPSYNASCHIENALTSVASQTYRPLEVIVVDDASEDNTVERAENFKSLNIKVIRLKQNVGPAEARNKGIAAATGKYIAFLDSDDEWLPNKTHQQVSMLEENLNCTIVGCKTSRLGSENASKHGPDPLTGSNGWKGLLFESWLHTSCVMTRAELVKEERFNPNLKVAEDRDLWIRLARRGEVDFVPEFLSRRLSSGYMHQNTSRMVVDLVPVIEGFVRKFENDLSRLERQKALGNVYTVTGKRLFVNCYYKKARYYFWKAILQRHRISENLLLILTSVPIFKYIKHYYKLTLYKLINGF